MFQVNDLLQMLDEHCHIITAGIARVGGGAAQMPTCGRGREEQGAWCMHQVNTSKSVKHWKSMCAMHVDSCSKLVKDTSDLATKKATKNAEIT